MPRTTPASAVTVVTDATFEQAVLQHPRPVLVDFWAEWCPPCHMIAPMLAQIAQERSDSLTVVALNSDENPVIAARYQVLSLPTLMLFCDGEPIQVLVGARPKTRLLRELDDALLSRAVPGTPRTPGTQARPAP